MIWYSLQQLTSKWDKITEDRLSLILDYSKANRYFYEKWTLWGHQYESQRNFFIIKRSSITRLQSDIDWIKTHEKQTYPNPPINYPNNPVQLRPLDLNPNPQLQSFRISPTLCLPQSSPIAYLWSSWSKIYWCYFNITQNMKNFNDHFTWLGLAIRMGT